jgi:uncharacterized membrane protein YkvA (DUF1232 family)
MDENSGSARDLLLFLPRLVVLLGKLVADPEVPALEKAILAGAVAYVVSPLDLIPDFIPVLGQIDDLYLVALVLLRFVNRAGETKLREHWSGPEDIVQLLGKATRAAVAILPPRVRALVEARAKE